MPMSSPIRNTRSSCVISSSRAWEMASRYVTSCRACIVSVVIDALLSPSDDQLMGIGTFCKHALQHLRSFGHRTVFGEFQPAFDFFLGSFSDLMEIAVVAIAERQEQMLRL